VACNSIKLGRDISAQGWGNFEVVTADRQVHEKPPVALGIENSPATPSRSKMPGFQPAGNFTMRPGNGKCNPFLADAEQIRKVLENSTPLSFRGLPTAGTNQHNAAITGGRRGPRPALDVNR
jgi:hypothetical protein